jgi:hypothetical protein
MAITAINIASATAPNWLKEAQESLAAAENAGGLMGSLQAAAAPGGGDGSIKTFLANSQNNANSFALISSSTAQASFNLISQMASTAAQKRSDEQIAMLQKLNPMPVNYNPPKTLDPVIYFDDGSSLDTDKNILTMSDGKQIDTTTGQAYIEPGSLIQMANGAYLDTKNNILTMSDGTKIDTVTGLVITV